MSTGLPVELTLADGIARVRFNRPNELNALNADVGRAFGAALDKVFDDATIKVIVLSGSGRAFMAGGDLAVFRDATDRGRMSRDLIDIMHASVKRLAEAPQIVVASLHGAVAGAGMSLAIAVDFAIAASDVVFNLAYSGIGATPDCGATWALPRLLGTRRALEIAFLSQPIGAEDALRIGLINRVVPPHELEAETTKIAAKLAAGPAYALARTKSLMRNSFDRTLDEQLALERDSFAACAVTADFAEGLDAFFARRKPKFSGGIGGKGGNHFDGRR
jgi:2-(1,2-epoxy-1,2-dihydrophenyl)acetyl-CoA isomerase